MKLLQDRESERLFAVEETSYDPLTVTTRVQSFSPDLDKFSDQLLDYKFESKNKVLRGCDNFAWKCKVLGTL